MNPVSSRRAALFGTAAALLGVCLPRLVRAAATVYSTTPDGVALGGYDAVAYFTERVAVPGNPDHALDWSGARWQFASAAHRDAFAADPARYAPVFGGWCAMAMVSGNVVEVDHVNAWSIYQNRLYLNVDANIKKRWQRSAGRLTRLAGHRWPDAAAAILAGEAEIFRRESVPSWY